jgi:hypothetical protein
MIGNYLKELRHGVQFNKLGKAHLVKQLTSSVQLLLDKKTDPPLVLGWVSHTLINNDLPVEVNSSETTAVQSKNAHMSVSCNDNTSNRTSKNQETPSDKNK